MAEWVLLNDVCVQGGSSSSYNMGKTSAGFGRVVVVNNCNMQNLMTGATHVGQHEKLVQATPKKRCTLFF
jgi:hypothetical protein